MSPPQSSRAQCAIGLGCPSGDESHFQERGMHSAHCSTHGATRVTLGAQIERDDAATIAEPRPIRGELFGATRLASHARELARRHQIAPSTRPGWIKRRERGPLLSRLGGDRESAHRVA